MIKENRYSAMSIGLLLVMAVFSFSVYQISEIEQVLVIQLGSPVRSVSDPGLHLRWPFIEQLHYFDKRLLVFDQEAPQEVLSADKKNLKVDNYARWRIKDPLRFFQTVRNEIGAAQRMNDIIYSNLREVLGQYTMKEIVSGARMDLMKRIRDLANVQTDKYGIEIVDVRIKRTDLPVENSKAVFRRMQTERERQAKQYRAEGEEEALKIRAEAARERKVILAEAYRAAQELRGAGDASAAALYAQAYEQDAEFFELVRSLEAYGKAFQKDTTVVMAPNGFFRLFKESPMIPKEGANLP
jgi:membrane protease subunit HflC